MPIQLLCGDNPLEIDEAARAVRSSFQGGDVITFEGTNVAFPALSEACLTAGLFDPERLVIVHGLHERFKGGRKESEMQEVRQILASIPPTTTLLLVERNMASDSQLAMVAREAGGEVRACSTPRKGDLPRWIMGRGARHRVSVEPAAAELLADLVGAQPRALDTELEKLSTYAGDEQRITPGMVQTLVGAVPQDSIFALVDAIAAGDQRQALRLLHDQLDSAASNPIDFALYLIRMLARQVRILLRIRLGRQAGRSNAQITTELKLSRYFADRYFRQAARLSTERLSGSFERLAALEHALKTGKGEAATELDLLVAEMCG